MTANVIAEKTIRIHTKIKIGAIGFISADFNGGYEEWKELPNLIENEGVLYGKSSFDTDLGKAVWRTDHAKNYAKIV